MRWTVLALVLLISGIGCASSNTSSGGRIGRAGQGRIRIEGRSGTLTAEIMRDDQTRQSQMTLDLDEAWNRLPALLEELGLGITFLNAESFLIGHRGGVVRRIDGKRLSVYIDCGSGTTAQPYANLYSVTLAYEVQLIPLEVEGRARADMRVEASARPRDVSTASVRCWTKGTLEQLLFERLAGAGEARLSP